MLPPEVTVELSQLLQALQSADNTIRSQAEDHLQNNWTVPRPEVLLMGLAEQVGGQASNSGANQIGSQASNNNANQMGSLVSNNVRSFAAVIFRRIASKTRKNEQGDAVEIFISLPAEQAQVIRQKLLEVLSAETDRSVRNKISDAIAEIARQYTENGSFPHPSCFLPDRHIVLTDRRRTPCLQTNRGPNFCRFCSR